MNKFKLPWKLKRANGNSIVASDGIPVAEVQSLPITDTAEFIVKACNSHAELLKLLSRLLETINYASHDPRRRDAVARADAKLHHLTKRCY